MCIYVHQYMRLWLCAFPHPADGKEMALRVIWTPCSKQWISIAMVSWMQGVGFASSLRKNSKVESRYGKLCLKKSGSPWVKFLGDFHFERPWEILLFFMEDPSKTLKRTVRGSNGGALSSSCHIQTSQRLSSHRLDWLQLDGSTQDQELHWQFATTCTCTRTIFFLPILLRKVFHWTGGRLAAAVQLSQGESIPGWENPACYRYLFEEMVNRHCNSFGCAGLKSWMPWWIPRSWAQGL